MILRSKFRPVWPLVMLSSVSILGTVSVANAQSAALQASQVASSPQTSISSHANTDSASKVLAAIAPESAAENVTVVGSALSLSSGQNANPVQIVTAKDIQQTSAVTLGDYLQRLPSIGSSAQQNTQPNGGVGMSCTDIRNLGTNRVLVLVDGKRQVQTFGNGGSCVNLNSIPIDQIASVEILKDGGSELYGADAVSGVINIKLRHDMTGGGVNIRGGISDTGDGQIGKLSGFKGVDFDQGRGNITVFGQYMTTSGVLQRDRDWSKSPWLSDTQIGGMSSSGSALTANTRVLDPDGAFNLISNGTGGGASGLRNFSSSDNYNTGSRQSLTSGLQESNLSGDARYDINDHLGLYASARYTHQTGSNIMAPLGITGAAFPSTLLSSIVLPAGSPYNIWGKDEDLYRRFTELGDRRFSEAYDTTQIIGGAKGRIVGNWNYDASMTYGASRTTIQTENLVNYKHLLESLGDDQLDPSNSSSAVVYNSAVCKASAGCQLMNPFSPINQSVANYLRATQIDHSMYQMRDFNLRTMNNNVIAMPYQGGGHLGLAAGIEHRSEQANYSPDPLALNGDLGGGSSYTGGGYDTTEAYIEGKLPLLQNVFLAKDLTVDAQGRWSNYNTFGNTYNWKASINWAPIADIRFRATLGTSFRAPSVSELYAGRGLGYYGGEDPCAQATSYGAAAARVIATCKASGIDTTKFVNANSHTLPLLGGGNPQLQPEQGRTYTIGTVITPRWIPGLAATVEYWHYTVKNTIGTLNGQYIVDQCYTGADTSYCRFIAPRSSSGQLKQIDTTNQNIGGLRTNGIDFDLNYRVRLTSSDVLTLSNNFQEVIGYTQQNVADGPWSNYVGRLFYQSGTGNPRVRDYATASLQHNNLSLTYMMSYTGGMKYNNGSDDVSCSEFSYCKVPGIFAHDVTVDYRFDKWNLEAGVNNILDKRPPFIPGSGINTAAGLYASEIIGRYMFAEIGVRF